MADKVKPRATFILAVIAHLSINQENDKLLYLQVLVGHAIIVSETKNLPEKTIKPRTSCQI